MEGIKVGEYVRIKHMYNNQKIAKIEKILDKDPCYKNMQMYRIDTIHQHSNGHFPSFEIYEEDIIKHSPNIIDLIEEGDYVNGIKVTGVMSGYVYLDKIDIETKKVKTLTDYQIKDIVTKEQFNQVKYEV